MNKAFVELDFDGKVVGIISHKRSLEISNSAEMKKEEAVGAIRYQVFKNSGHRCRNCNDPITWSTFHMHEVIPRGKGGEISTTNSIALCSECHIGRSGEHANRHPQWTKNKNKG